MNFKKFKRMLSIVLSASMLLSTNMTGLAAEAQEEPDVKQEVIREATAEESGIVRVESKNGTVYEASEPTIQSSEQNTESTSTEVAATGISLSATNKILIIGETFTLNATLTPPEATTQPVWTIADEAGESTTVASISPDSTKKSATISANQAGTAVVTVQAGTDENGDPITATCTIKVVEHTHNYQSVDRVPSTCQTEGKEAYYTCTKELEDGVPCDRLFTEKGGDPVTEESLKIPKKSHQPKLLPVKDEHNCVNKIPARYYCKSCERYYIDIDKFEKDTGTDESKAFQDKVDYWTKEADMKGMDSPEGHKYEYTFNWDGLKTDNSFDPGKDNGVTVTRTCRNKDIGCEKSESAEAANISVTKVLTDGYDCTQGGSATYTAVATFKTDEKEQAKDVQKKATKIVQIPKEDSHDYKFEFEWDEETFDAKADANNKLTYNPAGVTLKDTACSVCEKIFDSTKTKIEVTLADDEQFRPEDTLSCGGRTIKFVAILRDKTSNAEIFRSTKNIDVKGPAHSFTRVPASAADCENGGTHAYFECGNCHQKYWDGEGKQRITDESEIDILALGHQFFQPKFEWEDKVMQMGRAQATFECNRCHIKVVRDGLTVDTKGKYEKPETPGTDDPTCGEQATILYGTSVEFDRAAVSTIGGTPDYDESKALDPITYTGFVKRDKDIIDHEFEIAENGIVWKDAATAGGYNVLSNGLEVTIKCKTCGGTIVFETTNGEKGTVKSTTLADAEGQALDDVGGNMIITENTEASDYVPATCTEDGLTVYDIAISCDTHQTGGIETRYSVSGRTTTKTHQTDHKYVVKSLLWIDNSTIPDPNDSAQKIPDSTKVKVIMECVNGDMIKTGVTGTPASDTNEIQVDLDYIPITAETNTPEADFAEVSCMRDGREVWEVRVTYNNNPVLSATENKKLYLRKTIEHQGHAYEKNPDNIKWDWSSYGTEEDKYDPRSLILKPGVDPARDKVYAYYKCTNANCDQVEDFSQGSAGLIDGKWALKKESAKVELKTDATSGGEASCTTSGYIVYEATLSAPQGQQAVTNEQKFYSESKGHDWDKKVTWEWNKVTQNNETAYEITATVKCNNSGCTHNTTPLTCRVYTDSRTVDNNPPGCRINLTKNIQAPSCLEEGWETYTAKAEFADPDAKKLIEFNPGTDTFSKSMVTAALGHNYQTIWAWKGIVKNEDGTEQEKEIAKNSVENVVRYTSATVTSGCSRESDFVTETVTPTVRYGIIDGEKLEKPTCDKGAVVYYDAVTKDGQKTDTRAIEMPALGHKPGWKVNPDWDKIDENTKDIKAVQGCLNEIPDDVWTNNPDPEKYKIQTVTVEKDASHGPTCDNGGGTIVWTLMAGGQKIGTFEQEFTESVKGAHKIEVTWDTLKATDRDKNGKVTYEVEGTLTCEFNQAHNKKVLLEATADLGTSDCITPPQGEVEYTLTPIKQEDNTHAMVDIPAEELAKMSIIDGSVQSQPYGNTNAHSDNEVLYRTAAKTSQNCNEASYPLHYRCKYCGKTYKNSSATEEIEVSSQAQGHLYGEPEFRWSEDGTKVQAVFTCTRTNCPDATDPKIGHNHTREFWAKITGGKYVDKKPQCAESENGGKGIAYYPVEVDLSSEENTQGFAALKYSVEASVVLPAVPHNFINKNGVMKCEWCDKVANDVVQITFKGLNGRTISEKWIDRATSASSLKSTLPAAPNQIGYRFRAWDVNGTEYTTQDALAAALAGMYAVSGGSNDPIAVTAKYDALETQGSVQVVYVYGTNLIKTEDKIAKSGDIGTNMPVEAEGTIIRDNKTYYFSHWSSVKEGTDKLGTGLTYKVLINKDGLKQVYAIYAEQKPEEQEKIFVALFDKYVTSASPSNPKNKISFTFTISGFEESGFEFVDSGILYDTKTGNSADIASLNLENPDAKKLVLNGVKTNTLTVNVTDLNKIIAVRGYLRYTDGKEIYTVYSAVETDSYTGILNAQ